MKSNKRIMALLLCMLMVLSTVSALAADTFYVSPRKPDETKEQETAKADETPKAEPAAESDPAEPDALPETLPSAESKPKTEVPAATLTPAKRVKRWVWKNTDASWNHLIFLDENLKLTETLDRLADSCNRLNDMGQDVSVAYAERLFSKEQAEIFDGLDYVDQLYLTVLAAGHPDAVADYAFEGDAALLRDQIVSHPRWHASARAKYFPVKAVRIKGKLYRGFPIEILIKGEETMRDRFIFAYYGGEWVLSRIHVGEYK